MRRTKTSVAQRFVLTNKRQTDLNIRNKGSHSGLDKKNERRTDYIFEIKGSTAVRINKQGSRVTYMIKSRRGVFIKNEGS